MVSGEDKETSTTVNIGDVTASSAVIGNHNVVNSTVNNHNYPDGTKRGTAAVPGVWQWQTGQLSPTLMLTEEEVAVVFWLGRSKDMLDDVREFLRKQGRVLDLVVVSNSSDPHEQVDLDVHEREQWAAVVNSFRLLLRQIRASKPLHLFYAGPAILAMALGQSIGHNIHVKLHFYHRSYDDGSYYEIYCTDSTAHPSSRVQG